MPLSRLFDGGGALLLYDGAAGGGNEADRDVFEQLDAVEAVLREGGVATARFGVDLDLGRLRRRLAESRPAVVVNLVEGVAGSDRLQTLAPLVLEDWGVPFTGCGSAGMLAANDKIACKRVLVALGLSAPVDAAAESPSVTGDWIVKAAAAHASLFLDDASVLRRVTAAEAAARAEAEGGRRGVPFFAERFIDGREFNVSLLEDGGGVRVLPPAEICFDGLSGDRPRIVGYAAKWGEGLGGWGGVVRRFDFSPGDADLIGRLRDLALRVWGGLSLSGYARVDFRVDGEGRPYFLEANVNPCLSVDSSFVDAAGRAGLGYAAMVSVILHAALWRNRGVSGGAGSV